MFWLYNPEIPHKPSPEISRSVPCFPGLDDLKHKRIYYYLTSECSFNKAPRAEMEGGE